MQTAEEMELSVGSDLNDAEEERQDIPDAGNTEQEREDELVQRILATVSRNLETLIGQSVASMQVAPEAGPEGSFAGGRGGTTTNVSGGMTAAGANPSGRGGTALGRDRGRKLPRPGVQTRCRSCRD